MKLFYKISAAVLGVAATIALVQPQIAVGLSGREVGQVAREITVRIDGPANGSGAIVGKRDNVYTVLTNCHVVKEPGTYTIQTHAGSRYTVNANPSMCQPGGIDLAMLRFTSTRRYRVANLGNSSQLAVGDKVYASGWGDSSRHNLERRYRFRPGDITGRDPQAREGYTLAHTIQTGPGMSGGPILDEQGDVVGINGKGYRESTGEWEFLGIAINTYKNWKVAVLRSEERSTPPPDNPSREISRNTPPPSPTAPRPNTDNQTVYPSPTNYVLAKTLKGHSDPVWSVAISPDGQLLASGSLDETIKIWNLGSGELLHDLTGYSNPVRSVAFSPDGQLLASGSLNKIEIWNLESGKLLRTLNGHSDPVMSVAISPDRQLLASGSDDKTIKIWNLGSGELLHDLTGYSNPVRSVAISPDGQLLASGSWDGTIKIWNLESGKLLRTLSGHSSLVWSVAFSPDGQTIASGGGCSFSECNKDYDIRIWGGRGGERQGGRVSSSL